MITAGGTVEKIDQVRGITNFATGRLGKLTAERALASGHQVILLAGQNALLPEPDENLQIQRIGGVADLQTAMQKWTPQVDLVIHAMAVSDYQPIYMTGFENLPENLSKKALLDLTVPSKKKISSQSDFQVMLLQKTPKIISQIKQWNPKAVLIGFKLLAGVSKAELTQVAREKLTANHADFILANDLENIVGDRHEALLISQDQEVPLHTKLEIAQALIDFGQAKVADRKAK